MEAIQRVFDLNYVARSLPDFQVGLGWTLATVAVSLALAAAWGLFLVVPLMARRRWLRAPFRGYVEFSRNTPLLLQIFVLFFGLPLIGLPWPAFLCGALAVGGQHGCYLADVFRGASSR